MNTDVIFFIMCENYGEYRDFLKFYLTLLFFVKISKELVLTNLVVCYVAGRVDRFVVCNN